MGVTTSANGLSILHKGSSGKAISSLPDFCCIPTTSGKTPIPLMNKAESKDLSGGTVTVKVDGESVGVMGSMISQSSGDAAGILGGIVSGSTQDKAFFFSWSPDVFFEMRPVLRKTDKVIMNKCNTLCLPGWDQADVEGVEGREWVKFKIIEDDGSDDPKKGIKGVKVKITLPNGTKELESGPNGTISLVDMDPGKCSVELNEEEDSPVLKITERWPSTNLNTRDKHRIGVQIRQGSGHS